MSAPLNFREVQLLTPALTSGLALHSVTVSQDAFISNSIHKAGRCKKKISSRDKIK